MACTPKTRKRYRPRGGADYPRDLTAAQFAVIAPLIPPPKPGGRPRQVDIRDLPPLQTPGAGNLVTGRVRSGLRCMGATAVSALPSSGTRSNLNSGIVGGGGSRAFGAHCPLMATSCSERQALVTTA